MIIGNVKVRLELWDSTWKPRNIRVKQGELMPTLETLLDEMGVRVAEDGESLALHIIVTPKE